MNNKLMMTQFAAKSSANVLITGSSGSGKTLLARQIHEKSTRSARPFVSVNLATLYEGTLESELFGHEKGAFTGADQKRKGRLEAANGGTVFLDEIGELTPRLQARLLEFMQSRKIVPVGSNNELKLDVRIIAATNKNLEKEVASGNFREDLYHRLRVIVLELKPLCERADELDHIIHTVLSEISLEQGKQILRISREVALCFEQYSWPGNIRELRNVLEYAVAAAIGTEIKLEDLPPWFNEARARKDIEAEGLPDLIGTVEIPITLNYYETIARFEKYYLETVLERYRGRINLTARQIGMNKTTLLRRVKSHGLDSQ